MSNPSPSLMPKFKAPAKPVAAPTPALVADLDAAQPGAIVRPGLAKVVVETPHDGVLKAKHLKPGQTVRAFLHGKACGSPRTVDTVERIEDGAFVKVTFLSPHPTTTYKAAYRFFDESLVGTPVLHTEQRPALVAYEEV